jgi:uncharacterized repeat protein (TIGR01451 family)
MNDSHGHHARSSLALVLMILLLWLVADASLGSQNNVTAGPAVTCGTPRSGSKLTPAATESDWSLPKTVTPTTDVSYHGVVTYTLVLANNGLVSETNVSLIDTLPTEVDFARWVKQPVAAGVADDELTWSGAVTAGQAITFTFVVSHVGDYGNVVTNTAVFSGTQQTGSGDAVFRVIERMRRQFLPLTIKGHPFSPPFAIAYKLSYSEYAFAIQQTDDGSYIVAGSAILPGAGPVWGNWVLKLGSGGNVVWQKAYGSTRWERAWDIEQTDDGGYIVAAETYALEGGGDDAWVLKLDGDGNVVWQKKYHGTENDYIYAIHQTADGGYIMAGSSATFAYGPDAWAAKLDDDGSLAWQMRFAETYELRAIQQTQDGGYVAVGTEIPGELDTGNAWMLKLNGDGSLAWQRTYGGLDAEVAYDVQQTLDGGYIVVGWTRSFGAGDDDAWVLRLNASGDIVWQKIYGGTDEDWAMAIELTDDGGYVVAATIYYPGSETTDAWLFKLNADGSIAWQKIYGGTSWDHAYDVEQTDDGGYVVAGMTNSFETNGIWVLKVDANGDFCAGCSLGTGTVVLPVDSNATMAEGPGIPVSSYLNALDVDSTTYATEATVEPICLCSFSSCEQNR